MEKTSNRPSGMFGFTIVWIGQIVSVLASSMSQFALTIFMFNETGSALAMGTMQVFFITPFLLISPLAGVWVDRYNRKLMMMVSDIGAGIATIIILVLQAMGILEYWHLYGASIIYGLGMAFQWPAYSAAISTMVSKEQLGRANGMMSLIEAGPQVIAPILTGALLPVIALTGILFLDVISFLFAISALLFVHIPQPVRSEEGMKSQAGGILSEAAYGFKYIFARPSLLGLQMVFFFGNLFAGIGFTVLAPMILTRSGGDSLVFGTVESAGAIAAVVGGVAMSAWGGFKRRVHGVLLGWMISGIGMAIIGFTGGLPIWITGVAITAIASPLVNASNQAIWQSKVSSDLQGRVFSARRLIAWLTNPISPLIGGALADFVLEPAALAGTGLPSVLSNLVGVGAGAGMGTLILFCGLASALTGMAGYFSGSIRNAETILPDHNSLAPEELEPA
ncbi:MAG TPA: MFS transporter [Anaerolineales bacterium]|nr:MFS transporter [Anaerolineales bacterium]HNQ93832.1 MFS transporter [Anaerolineales bacterium]HNS60471.1 MFS transporter [Anaerolineales bacterium]